MVIWFFENNQFADAWIPFDRPNQKKLEYVYRHNEELVDLILQQQQKQHISIDTPPMDDDSDHNKAQLEQQQQQQLVETLEHQFTVDSTIAETKCLTPPALNEEETLKGQLYNHTGGLQSIQNIDLDEEDASIQQFIKYAHNCIYINLLDSHFEQEITLYPAMLLGSLPDRDILIMRAAEQSRDDRIMTIK